MSNEGYLMDNNTDDVIKCLFNKYTFLWNHYKLQNECMEKRRYLFWIIQSVLLVSFLKIGTISKGIYINSNFVSPIITLMLFLLGLFISIGWFIVSIRDRSSIKNTENQLRETEDQWNNIKDITIELNIFNRDKDKSKWKIIISQRLWLDYLTPLIFIFIWIFLGMILSTGCTG